MRVAERFGGLLVAFGLLTSAQATQPDPLDLLDRMNNAIRSLDYEGRFVVQSGERLDALYIVHRVNNGSEMERVVSLTGDPREIIRGDKAVACLVPGGGAPINLGRRAQGRSYSPLTAINGRELRQFYEFHLLEPERVAGRDTYQIRVAPRDNLRFGFRLFIDRESSLPLRSIMVDDAKKTLSQMMFTELKIGEGITPIERDLAALQIAQADPADWRPLDRLAPAAWAFAQAPPGFRLNVHRRRALPDKSAELEHFIFSDGLATVSVYVQPAQPDGVLSGVSHHGAANAVGRPLGQHEVVVVGEVPVKTLQLFAQAIHSVQ
jgi:sigma-E factor negative regulatory protein RseB